jgi:hypothetical protein
MNKMLLGLILLSVTSCSPISEYKSESTKYPETPTMQAAEDATTGKLFKD